MCSMPHGPLQPIANTALIRWYTENSCSAGKSVIEGVLEIGAHRLGTTVVEFHAEDDFRRY